MPVLTAPLPRLLEIALAACAVAPGAVGLPRFAAWRSAQHTLLSPHYRANPVWEIDLARELCDALGFRGFEMPGGDDPLRKLADDLGSAQAAFGKASAEVEAELVDPQDVDAAARKASRALDALLVGARALSASPLWAVHVRGPDDVVPVASYEDAVRLSDWCNAFWLTLPLTEDDPWVSAVPMPWDGTAESHAEGLRTVGGSRRDYAVPDEATVQAMRARAMESRVRDGDLRRAAERPSGVGPVEQALAPLRTAGADPTLGQPYEQGRRAHDAGEPEEANPYGLGSEPAVGWVTGHRAAAADQADAV